MSEQRPVFDQVNLVVRDIDATVAFYRRLGLPVSDSGGDWPEGSGARHVEVEVGNGMSLEFDNMKSGTTWHRGISGPTAVLGFTVASREAVDELYAELTNAGAVGRQEPYDAFWGGRYAVVADPDGNDVGIMGPKDVTGG